MFSSFSRADFRSNCIALKVGECLHWISDRNRHITAGIYTSLKISVLSTSKSINVTPHSLFPDLIVQPLCKCINYIPFNYSLWSDVHSSLGEDISFELGLDYLVMSSNSVPRVETLSLYPPYQNLSSL